MAKRTPGELKRLAREYLNGNYTILIVAMLITSILPSLVLAPFSAGVTAKMDAVMVTYMMAAFIIEVLRQLLTAGLTRMHLRLAQNQPFSYKDLFWIFRSHPDRFILAALLFYGILLIPLTAGAAGIFILFNMKSVPGYVCMVIIILAVAAAELYFIYMFGLIYPLYIDNPDMSVLEGFRTSRTLMKGNKLRRFLMQLSFAGWQILGFLSAGIGILWISPYIRQTTTNFYLDLTGQLDKNDMRFDA